MSDDQTTSGNKPLTPSDLAVDDTQKALDKAAKTEQQAAEDRLYDGPPPGGNVERVGSEYSEADADDPTGQKARFAASDERVAARTGKASDAAQAKRETATKTKP